MTNKQIILLLLVLTTSLSFQAQSVTGTLTQHAGQQIALTGFDYFKTIQLSKTAIDSLGNFVLNYSKDYNGMGVLNTQDNSSLILVLTEKNIKLQGKHLKQPNRLVFKNSINNKNFMGYTKTQGLHTNALSAWSYLENLYETPPFLLKAKKVKKTIQEEQKRIQKEDAAFINGLSKNSYMRWFIPYRKLIQDMPMIVKSQPERIPEAIEQFRSTHFTHPNFKTSGLFKELLEGHYLLLENMGQPLDSVYRQMNKSTQHLIDDLQTNEKLINEVASHLFNLFEKRSLFKASEYLSVSLLNNTQCSLTDDLVAKLESYRTLKVGAIAPDIALDNHQKVSDLKTNKLIVFGASWCPACKKEALELLKYYDAWKIKNVKIIYISIDTDKTAFKTAYKNAPWQIYCDFKGWDTQATKDYYIFGTPSYFLVDADNKILVRPNSVAHANTWIEYKL